jgi:hypothetical protein
MPLSIYVDSLDLVPEAVRGEYAPDGERFKLDLSDLEVVTESKASALKSALVKERAVNGWMKSKLTLTPDELHDALRDEAGRLRHDTFAKLIDQHVTQWAGEKTTLEKELSLARASEKNTLTQTVLEVALRKSRATEEGVQLLSDRLSQRISMDTVDGKRVVTILSQDGVTPLQNGSGKNGAGTFDDLMKETIWAYPSLFKGSGAGGGGTPVKSPTPAPNTISRAEFDRLDPVQQSKTVRRGITIHD